MPTAPPSSAQALASGAPVLAACWAASGSFDAKRPRVVDASRWPTALEVSYIACEGDTCEERRLTLRPHAGGRLSTLPPGLAGLLLRQPIALAALGGMLTLGACILLPPSRPTNAVLGLLGGPSIALAVFIAAVCAHIAEAGWCFAVLHFTLKQPIGTALGWYTLVSLVGWPITRRVVQLKRAAAALDKRN